MSEADILEISRRDGITVGSHCMSHEKLTSLDKERAFQEISVSKSRLEGITGEKIRFLSFPHGEYSGQHVAFAKECGYEKVFGITPSLAEDSIDNFLFGRVRVDPTDSDLEFFLKVHGSYRWLPVMFKIKHLTRKVFGGT
jgi:peptidoglycan/xylan/chitin deacetylase (PgdA/CDA1 family)